MGNVFFHRLERAHTMPDADRVLSNEALMAEVHARVARLRAILQASKPTTLPPAVPPALAPASYTSASQSQESAPQAPGPGTQGNGA